MRGQASIETIFAIGILLTLTGIVALIFIGQRDEVFLFEEEHGAEQVCFSIRNTLISLAENGTQTVIETPIILNKEYTLEFIEGDLHVNTERGFFCTLPYPVYNNTNSTIFEIDPGKLLFTNTEGMVYVEKMEDD